MKTNLSCLFLLMSFSLYGQEASTKINNSIIAFTIPEKDLLPENITYDPVSESFFVGSTRKGKIVRIDKSGNRTDFITQKPNGLYMVIGMKVDSKNRWLWVCSSGGDNLIDYRRKDDKEGRPAGIFKFDLETGKLIKKYTVDVPGEVHFFNDLVLDNQGNAYITHMFSDAGIYTIQKASDRLELFTKPDGLRYPNGITISDDQKYLFVAHSDGIGRLEIENKVWTPLSIPEGLKISRKESIDGLYYYKSSLIGVQQDVNSVQKFFLGPDDISIEKSTVLEANHPMMNKPTTGVLVGDSFYYIANSQFGSFDENHVLFPPEKLYEVCVLKLSLD